MHLTDHLSEEQLNEYLDRETNERAAIELHLSTCEECSARLAALQELFSELASLPELELSRDLHEAFAGGDAGMAQSSTLRLPRSLTLAVVLQAALAIVTVIAATPFVTEFLAPYLSSLPPASPLDIFLQLRLYWTTWLDVLSQIRLPSMPSIPSIPLSSLMLSLTVLGASLLWLIGNGLLLRKPMKPGAERNKPNE